MSTPEHIPITILLSFQVHHLLALFSQNHGVCPPSCLNADAHLTLALKTFTDSFLTLHTPNMCNLILFVPIPFAYPGPSSNLLSLLALTAASAKGSLSLTDYYSANSISRLIFPLSGL